MSDAFGYLKQLLREQLQLGDRVDELTAESPILGAIPEFDSVAAVAIITAIEEDLGAEVDDDELTGEIFETVGSLTTFIASKM